MLTVKANYTQRTTLYNSDPHTHEGYELYFLLEGKREVFSNNKILLLPPKTFYVFRPFRLHQTKGEACTKVDVRIAPSLLTKEERDFLDFVADGHPLSLEKQQFSLYVALLKKTAEMRKSDVPHAEDYAVALTKSLLLFLQQENQLDNAIAPSDLVNPLADPLIVQITSYLDQHYASKITLKDLCEHFFFSKVVLCKRFKDSMQCSIMEYLLRLRITEAQVLLRETDKSMEQIAELCGFSSANYFGLIFKKLRGCSPLHYRKLK